MKKCRYFAWLLVFAIVFLAGFGDASSDVMAREKKAAVKTVSLKIGSKEVTKKTYKMEQGGKKKIKVTVLPENGKKTIKFSSNKKEVASVSKNGTITAKKVGISKINVTVKAGGAGNTAKKTTWVKIRVTKPSDTDTTPTEKPDPVVGKKSIVVYFSCTDNTKRIAEYIQEGTASDIYRMEPSVPYTSADLNYGNDDSRTSKEQNDPSARPEIAGNLPDISDYEVVYLGYPIWWGQAPKIMYTFVESCDLSGKTIVPFCTSGSSGIGSSATNLQAADTSQAVWLAGRRFSGSSPKSNVESWLAGLGL